ncbi:MAG: lytic transglycosylase domain-containing protein [Oscillospiraceae bacterium]|nr:lytic transglycosylase domain-containing protein [Oscillospiraceae bacterium]
MVDAAQKVREVMGRVEARLQDIGQTAGISFSSTLAVSMETAGEQPRVVYNEAYARFRPEMSGGGTAEEDGYDFSRADAARYPDTYDDAIREACEKYDVDMALVKAVIRAESSYRPDALSRAGAMGLMQLMPGTAAGLGVTDAYNPEQNIDGGVRYLRQMLDRWDGDVRLALASYNWGPGAVNRSGVTDLTDSAQISRIPSSTAGYIERILRFTDELKLL